MKANPIQRNFFVQEKSKAAKLHNPTLPAEDNTPEGLQTLMLPDGSHVEFPTDQFAKHCMLEGIDELGYILQQEPAIAAAYESARPLTINKLA